MLPVPEHNFEAARGCEYVFYGGAFSRRCRPGLSHHGRGVPMTPYTHQVEPRKEIVADDFKSAANRYALRLSRQKGFTVAHVRTALLANAAVKEH